MAFSIKKFLKGILIQEENSLTPKEIEIVPGGNSGTKTVITSSQTVNRNITLPDADETLLGRDTVDTLTNKSIDADNNTITNISDDEIKAAAGIDASKIANGSVSNSEFQYLDGLTGNIQDQLNDAGDDLNDHINEISGAHTASAITNVPSGDLTSTDVQAALNELQGDVNTRLPLTGGTMTGNIDLNSNYINNLPTPVSAGQAVNKEYVDSLSAGLDPKESCRVATIADLSATYNTSPSNGQFTSAPSTIDGVSLSIGDRVLVKDQTDLKQNGIYVYSAANTLTRSADMDGNPTHEISAGNYTFITQGDTNVSKGFVILGSGDIVVNVDDIEFSQFSGATNTALRDLSNLTSPTAINQNLLPDVNFTRTLGDSTHNWLAHIAITYDTSNNPTASLSGRELYDSIGNPSLQWQTRGLFNSTNVKVLDYSGQNLSVNSRKLIDVTDAELNTDAVNRQSLNRAVKNYIANHDAILNTSGYATYKDAATANPEDGTGGSPTVTYTRTTSTPLRGVASFLFTKDGSNRQGEGFSYDFTIDPADRGKVLQGSFDYAIASGTYADDRMAVWIYDVTNARLIQPAPYLIKNHTLPAERMNFEFQTSIDSTSYRLIFHVASSNTAAYTIKFDNISVGPQAKLYGSAVTDWVSYTPTGSWTTNTTYTGRWRRVGDSMEIKALVSLSGAPNAANLAIAIIPSGYSIDSTKALSSTAIQLTVTGNDSGTLYDFSGFISGNLIAITYTATTSGAMSEISNTAPFSFNSGDSVGLSVTVPILGWSSSQIMSHDASTRVVSTVVTRNSAAVTGGVNIGGWNAPTKDSHGTFNPTTGVYTVAVPGDYYVSLSNFLPTSGSAAGSIIFNSVGQAISNTATAGTTRGNVSTLIPNCKAGDLISIRSDVSTTLSADLKLTINMLQGPAQIAASESVSCEYKTSAGGALGNGVYTYIDFGTKVSDSHGSVVGAGNGNNTSATSTWRFVAKTPGRFHVSTGVTIVLPASTECDSLISISKNGDEYFRGTRIRQVTTVNGEIRGHVVSGTVSLLAGEFVSIVVYQASGASRNLGANNFNFVTIDKVGNYA